MDTNQALNETNRSRLRIPDKMLFRIAIALTILMFLFASFHYVWYRARSERMAIETLELKLESERWNNTLLDIHHQKALIEAKYSLSLIPFEDVTDMTMENKDGAK